MAKSSTTSIESYKLVSGETRYMFKFYIGVDPVTGKEKRTTRRGFKTIKEAKIELSRLRLEIEKGTYNKQSSFTYKDIYNLWIIQYQKSVEDSTYNKTLGYFKNHILPAFGEYKIQKINIDICQSHVNEWHSKFKKYKTIKSYAAMVLKFALKRGYITNNPFDLVDLPTTKQDRISGIKSENYYTKDQLLDFLTYLEKDGDFKAFVFFRLLAFSGMRKGEAFALTWKDIDFKNQEINIEKAVTRGSSNNLYVKSTKNGISRKIKMDNTTMILLAEWKEHQKIIFNLNEHTSPLEQLVFSNRHNELIQPTKAQQWIKKVQNKYKLPLISPHGLRHTHCSLLFEAGATLKEVQDRLGHSDVQTTLNIYTHVTKQARSGVVQKFDDFLKK